MKVMKRAAFLGMAALLASAPAAFAAESGPAPKAKDAPRVASARPTPAPPSSRIAPSGTVPSLIGELPAAPAVRMADTIAEFYASGILRLY